MGPPPVSTVTGIGPRDAVLQTAFCDYVPQVFRRADFRHWREWGEWDDDYRAFALFEDGHVVANASVMRMRLRMDGREVPAFQLGAVGCIPSHRERGLSRVVMDAALEACGDAPVLLFANPRVREFYPRFGFQPWKQTLFAAEHEAVPEGPPAPTLDLEDAKVRARFAAISREGLPSTERFGARGYATVASWHVANGFARPLRQLGPDTWVSASVDGDTLHLDDVFTREPFDLRASLPRLIDRPIRSIRFGFTPERWWPGAVEAGEDTEADLFVRKLTPSPDAHRFPVLAHT
ncbi:GNAT family N-acetyltransferase [Pyxidicoccus sp. MSG2]|uniref:GNAT family N-acetyltransferase n=1 Tax=Pyxidicoccus sp. MSG2 TaxID=2996790 RepID=UPI00226D5904|nr:GNAT family N-acetyltransferase [Pyxidicoccus sp. MSG2]MCY1017439.1 GNAT family N-acetyltransferase [Pyxidicoccus sp. MSG2]